MSGPVPDILKFMLEAPPGYMTVSHLVTPSGIPELTLVVREERFVHPSEILLFPHIVMVQERLGVFFFSLRAGSFCYAAPFNFHGDFGTGRTGKSILRDLDRQDRIVLHVVSDEGLNAVSFPNQHKGKLFELIDTLERMPHWTIGEFHNAVQEIHQAYPKAEDILEAAMENVRSRDSMH